MEKQRPVAAIAKILGLEPDYCRKATRRLAAERGIDYQPEKDQPGGLLTEASRRLRNHLANVLYAYRNKPGQHPLAVSRETGLTQAQQIQATERGGRHDWAISETERLATATGQEFKSMMLRALLTPEEYQKVARCLSS
jgi:hypothetical protein